MTINLTIAVCLFEDVAILDFQGPMELLGFLNPDALVKLNLPSTHSIKATFLSPTMEPVAPWPGPLLLLPNRTYDDVKDSEQFDILLVPGGITVHPTCPELPQSVYSFLKRQAPGAKYIISVCTGAYTLAQAGILDGKRATTNKASFKAIREATADRPITWIPKARWVVDEKLWTSSGVTAGIDMAQAFLQHLVGDEVTSTIRASVEVGIRQESDDEFAAIHGLV